jgi:hypothetical protein
MRELYGGRPGGNPSRGRTSDKADVLRLRPIAVGDQNTGTNAGHRWCNDQMAKRTAVGSGIGMVMPDNSKRGPEQKHQKRYRDHYTTDSFLVSHF